MAGPVWIVDEDPARHERHKRAVGNERNEGNEPEPDERVGVPEGWSAHAGFDLPASPWDLADLHLACTGEVADATSAAAALLALSRGAALVVRITAQGDVRHRFEEDLRKLTTPTAPARTEVDEPTARLDGDQVALLDALADGATVTAAARQLNLSRRTANRRLADAREALGVDTTVAAVTRWSKARHRRG